MAFDLNNVVPWGRNLREYTRMFALSEQDRNKRILGCGDGPAAFNAEWTRGGGTIISIDPIYAFSREQIRSRIEKAEAEIVPNIRANMDRFKWTFFPGVDDLVQARLEAMEIFLADFETGKKEGRYLAEELPGPLPFRDGHFDLGLSSHFLMLYVRLGLDFHLKTIREMMRTCRETRIFPLVDLDANRSEMLDGVRENLKSEFTLTIERVPYEFQKDGNEMLRICRKETME